MHWPLEHVPTEQGPFKNAHWPSPVQALGPAVPPPVPVEPPRGQVARLMVCSHTPEVEQLLPEPPQQLEPGRPQLTLPPALPSWVCRRQGGTGTGQG